MTGSATCTPHSISSSIASREADRDAARFEIVPKLEAASAPSGPKSVRFLSRKILTPPLKRRCLPIYARS